MPGLFGTSGIRGDAEKLFSSQFCFDIGRAFGKFLVKRGWNGAVAVGMDPRGSSPKIKAGVMAGLAQEGWELFDEGAVPAPAMCYVLQVSDYKVGAVMVTGSHIKANLNGVKFFVGDGEITKKDEGEIEKIYQSLAKKKKYKEIETAPEISEEGKTEYSEMLMGLAAPKYPHWRVVVDAGDGSQSDIMPEVLRRLGLDVVEMNTTLQGEFFARDTENQADFAPLMRAVPKQKADFGVGYDADGDRVIFVNRKGEFIPGDYTAGLIAKYAAGKAVVTPIATSQVVEHLGKQVIRTKVGSPYLVEALKKHGAKFAFEANGGGMSAEIMYTRDGGATTIKLLNILAKQKKSLEAALSELPKFYLVKTKLDYKWEQKEEILRAVRMNYKKFKMDETDGLKIWLGETTWMLFRSSLNAPEFRVFAESEDKKKAERLLKEGRDLVWRIVF